MPPEDWRHLGWCKGSMTWLARLRKPALSTFQGAYGFFLGCSELHCLLRLCFRWEPITVLHDMVRASANVGPTIRRPQLGRRPDVWKNFAGLQQGRV